MLRFDRTYNIFCCPYKISTGRGYQILIIYLFLNIFKNDIKLFSIIKIIIDNLELNCYVITQHLTKIGNKEATCQESANTQNTTLHVKTIDRHLAQVDLNKIARSSKFYQRTPQKVTAVEFVKSLCNAAYQGIFSYSKVAFLLGLLGINISKQGVSDRININGVAFLKQVLNAIIQDKAGARSIYNAGLFKTFGNVYLQDSTHLALPDSLADIYPGAKNQSRKKSAGLKIQAIFSLFSDRLTCFSLSPFTRPDQSASKDILDCIKTGDLIIRDLGYFVLSVFKELVCNGVFLLSRYKSNVSVYCPETGKKLSLLKLLNKNASLDIPVLVGAEQKVPMRLVAVPVPDSIANERRRKAKNNRDRHCNPSEEALKLLGWEIFVTNVDNTVWASSDILEIYGIRWRIEIIFKTWKSHLSIKQIPERVSSNELEIYLYAHLMNIIFFHAFFDQLNQFIYRKYKINLSILKIAPLFDEIINSLLFGNLLDGNQTELLLEHVILRHCCYEERKGRINYYKHLNHICRLA